MNVFTSAAEMMAAKGRDLGFSDWIEVSQARINKFAEATEDFQWIHVDPERARTDLPGGRTIAHGYLTLSLVPIMLRGVIRLDGLRTSINYGNNRVRFLAPVPSGTRLRGRFTIAEATPAPPTGTRVTYSVTVEGEGMPKPACMAEVMAVHYW